MKIYNDKLAPDPRRVRDWLDAGLAGKDFVAGRHFSIADITTMCAIAFGRIWRFAIPDSCENAKRWYKSVAARPSAQA